MVKYGKEFASSQIIPWKDNYLKYKFFKRFIRASHEKIECSNKLSNNNLPPTDKLENTFGDSSNSDPKSDSQSQMATLLEDILNEFVNQIEKEIKRIYIFFIHNERELYIQINSHLHIRPNYENFNMRAIAKELEELNNLSTSTFSLSKFINDNMIALKKILKKFDKKFEKYYGEKGISMSYITNKTEVKNSDLLYILQFRIIDEVCALLEELMMDLKTKYEYRKKTSTFSSQNSKEEKLIFGSEIVQSADFIVKDKDLNIYIVRNINELSKHLVKIDEFHQNFKSNFKEWNISLKKSFKANSSRSYIATSNDPNYSSFRKDQNDVQINFDLTKSTESDILFSKANSNNIFISLFQTFFFMFNYSIVIPLNINYVKMIGYDYYFSGFVMSLTPFGMLISSVYNHFWIFKSYKHPLMLSMILLLIGNLFYAFAYTLRSIIALGISRFLIGLGASRVANRGYLLRFIPKRKLSQYLLFFQICSITGLAIGPLVSIPMIYLAHLKENDEIFNDLTYSSWLCFILSFILLFFVVFSFVEPVGNSFSIYSEDGIGSDPVSRAASVSIDNISRDESHITEELNDKLSEINEQNKFSDSNLVSKSIEAIAWREKKTVSYLYKSFTIFATILFVVRVVIEALLVVSPYYVNILDSTFDSKNISLLMGISLLISIPMSLFCGYFFGASFQERKVLITLTVLCMVFNFFILNLWNTSLVQYCLMFVLLIISSTLLENMGSKIFSKIIPCDYERWGVGVGMSIQLIAGFGRVIGALMLTLSGLTTYTSLNLITYGATLFLFVVALLMIIFFYSELRVKAIARILRGKALRKLKRTEF